MLIVSGSNQHFLAFAVASILSQGYIQASVDKFSDQELKINLLGDYSHQDVFIFLSTCSPANDHLMELFLIADKIYLASPKSITAVIPYFGYSRQDRKFQDQSISKNTVFSLLASVGISSVITLDLHSDTNINLPFKLHNIAFWQIFWQDLSSKLLDKDTLIVSPDSGSSHRAKVLAQKLGLEALSLGKTRMSDGSCVINCANDQFLRRRFEDKHCILVDDIVDKANTLSAAADFLHKSQAKSIDAYVTHGVFSAAALELIERSLIQNLYITDSIPQRMALPAKITVLPTGNIISAFIRSACS
jgi:ribose-phosphate pyrophosphokinase